MHTTSHLSPLSPGGRLEYTLVMSLARRGVAWARAPLAAALVTQGVPSDVVLAAATSGGPTPHRLLSLAAEHLRAVATRACGAASQAVSTKHVVSAFGELVHGVSTSWLTTQHVLGLVHGGHGIVRTGCTSMLFVRAPEPSEGAADETCNALVALADGLTRTVGSGACAALDDIMLSGSWAPSDALSLLATIARTGEAMLFGDEPSTMQTAALDDAGRAAEKARHAALRVRQARMSATVSRLLAQGDVAAALRRLLRAALLPVSLPHAFETGPQPWPSTGAACAVTCAVAADAARARCNRARSVLLLCAVGAELVPGSAFSDVLPEALQATQAALLALFLATHPAAPGELPPGVLSNLTHARCVPCLPAAACEYLSWLADMHGVAATTWLDSRVLASAGASLATHLLMASASSTAIALPRRVCTYTSRLYFQQLHYYQQAAGGMRGALPAAETMLSFAAAAVPPDGTDTSPCQASLCFLGGLVFACRAQAAMLLAASATTATEQSEAQVTHDEALCRSVALFSRAAVGITATGPVDADLAALLGQVRTQMEAPEEVCSSDAVGYFRTLVLFFEQCVDAPAAAYACTLAALSALTSRQSDGSAVDAGQRNAIARVLWSNAFRHTLACRRWRDAYTALLGGDAVWNDGDHAAVREHASRLVGAACDAFDGGQLLHLPWASPVLGAALDTALARRASGSATSQQARHACQLLVASRIQAGQYTRAAAALLAHARRCAAEQQSQPVQMRGAVNKERCDALLHAATCLDLAPEGLVRFLVERLPSTKASTWPPGVGCVPLPPPQPHVVPGTTSGLSPAELGYQDVNDGGNDADVDMMDEDNGREETNHQLRDLTLGRDADMDDGRALLQTWSPTDEDVYAALGAVTSGAGGMHALAMAASRHCPVRIVTAADINAEYALLSAQATLAADVVATLPGDCTDADADCTVAALVAAAQFGPAAALACAWYADRQAAKGVALEPVVAALATRAASGWVEHPHSAHAPQMTLLGDSLGRTRGDSPGTPQGPDAAWYALQRLLHAHSTSAPRLKSVAADAALRVAPTAPLPDWLVHHFTGEDSTQQRLFSGAGSDVAELLRLYIRHGALRAAGALALDVMRVWDEAADPRVRASPNGCCFPYGALDALRDALAASTQGADNAGLLKEVDAALQRHVALARNDSARVKSLGAAA